MAQVWHNKAKNSCITVNLIHLLSLIDFIIGRLLLLHQQHALISLPPLDFSTAGSATLHYMYITSHNGGLEEGALFKLFYTGCMMQVHHGRWVRISFLFIGGRKPTYVGFLMDSTRKGYLIPVAVVFSIQRGCIFHSRFFSNEKPLSLGKYTRRL